ncbi:MAG: NAD(P)H-dependent glycerol-3-phosphate dehydrogenase [Eubacteriales bacterium]
MKITVIGCGRWGTFIAWYLQTLGHRVTLCGRESSPHLEELKRTRTNGTVALPEDISLSSDHESAIRDSGIVVVSVASQALRALMSSLPLGILDDKTLVLCMKGLEDSTGLRLSLVAGEYITDKTKTAVWVGPGHVQQFVSGIPNCMVIDSEDTQTKQLLIKSFAGPLIRFYYGTDLIGSEIGAASKNVVGIAAGMLDGLGRSSLKGALMARGTREIARLIEALGGSGMSAYGLCHLGDYEATLFSEHSHNRRYGEAYVKGEEYAELAEGVYTSKALASLSKSMDVDLPISTSVYRVLFEGADAGETLQELFLRSLKEEF